MMILWCLRCFRRTYVRIVWIETRERWVTRVTRVIRVIRGRNRKKDIHRRVIRVIRVIKGIVRGVIERGG